MTKPEKNNLSKSTSKKIYKISQDIKKMKILHTKRPSKSTTTDKNTNNNKSMSHNNKNRNNNKKKKPSKSYKL